MHAYSQAHMCTATHARMHTKKMSRQFWGMYACMLHIPRSLLSDHRLHVPPMCADTQELIKSTVTLRAKLDWHCNVAPEVTHKQRPRA